ncbi:His-Xaa-Ser system protein HxsD [Methylophilus sp. 5]|uniref:His-Xaa-Ser system protein HxsD n=1 Tax=Methylophilus sp. 5 TaxID=1112274 RepID=UPI00048F7D9B|nr:His-Xaa-Ser system protein HxsD [Methylophilus sp. 5]
MSKSELTLKFDERVYSVETIQKAAYRFINKFTVDFELIDRDILCHIIFDSEHSDSQLQKLKADFKKEILDQHLRQLIAKETETVRNLILSATFLNTGLQKIE